MVLAVDYFQQGGFEFARPGDKNWFIIAPLINRQNEKRLKLGIAKVWRENGKKNTGTWEEVFGNGYESKAYCTVWQYASYINHVAEAGKAEYPLPMYCNCWLVQKEEDLPGCFLQTSAWS